MERLLAKLGSPACPGFEAVEPPIGDNGTPDARLLQTIHADILLGP